jgi:uncharacterized delta-60 repeat protein
VAFRVGSVAPEPKRTGLRTRVAACAVVLVAAALPGAAGAAPGDLDPSFGNGGIVTTVVGGGGANALAILPNGKIVAVGGGLARYLPDGSLDPVFDGDGKVTAGGGAGVAIQPNGRIVTVRGGNDFEVARYRRDGSLDPTFGGDGKVITDLGPSPEDAWDVVIQADGKIVVAGTRFEGDLLVGDFAVVRYNPDGTLDADFGSGGIVLTQLQGEAFAVALQDDGRIVLAGTSALSGVSYDIALVRYEADGTLDTSFDGDGIAIVDLDSDAGDVATDVALQSDGKFVVAGWVDPKGPEVGGDFLLARFNPDGSLDTQGLDPYLDAPFGVGGWVTTDFDAGDEEAWAVAIESGGKIVVGGRTGVNPDETPSDFALARYNVDGSLDQTFGSGGKLTTEFETGDNGIGGLAIQADGAIVAAGRGRIGGVRQFALARYLAAPCCGMPAGVPATG